MAPAAKAPGSSVLVEKPGFVQSWWCPARPQEQRRMGRWDYQAGMYAVRGAHVGSDTYPAPFFLERES